MSMESTIFAVSFAQDGSFAEGTNGPRGKFKLPIDSTLIGVSFHADGVGEANLQVDVDGGDMGILEKTITAGAYTAVMYGRSDFGYPAGQPPLYQKNQYPHITKDHTVMFLTNVDSGTLSNLTVVFYFLAG